MSGEEGLVPECVTYSRTERGGKIMVRERDKSDRNWITSWVLEEKSGVFRSDSNKWQEPTTIISKFPDMTSVCCRR